MLNTEDACEKIIIVESWNLMRKFMEEAVRKMNEFRLEMVLPDYKKIDEAIIGNDISLLIAEYISGREDEVFSAIKRVREKCPGIKIVVTTLTTTGILEEKAKDAGADGIWQKEISEDSFIRMCRSTFYTH